MCLLFWKIGHWQWVTERSAGSGVGDAGISRDVKREDKSRRERPRLSECVGENGKLEDAPRLFRPLPFTPKGPATGSREGPQEAAGTFTLQPRLRTGRRGFPPPLCPTPSPNPFSRYVFPSVCHSVGHFIALPDGSRQAAHVITAAAPH